MELKWYVLYEAPMAIREFVLACRALPKDRKALLTKAILRTYRMIEPLFPVKPGVEKMQRIIDKYLEPIMNDIVAP